MDIWFECDFTGIYFNRTSLEDLKKWVRTAGRNVYGKDTQIIFLVRKG